MSDVHYVRTPGEDALVDEATGRMPGVDLGRILAHGLPPWNIALELITALCEILDIADEDGRTHGDVHPQYIKVDARGRVHLGGFGKTTPRAPERRVHGRLTDRYGLGYTALSLLTRDPMPHPPPPLDPDPHEDLVVAAVHQLDFTGLPEAMRSDVQWFVAKWLAHRPEDRPTPLDAWHTFVAYARAVDGPDFVVWCAEAVAGRPRTRRAEPGGPDATAETEVLVAPVSRTGPLRRGLDLSGDRSEGTALWSRDELRQAVRSTESVRPPQGFGGGETTAFWSNDQRVAMRERSKAMPRPQRVGKARAELAAAPTVHQPRPAVRPEVAGNVPRAVRPEPAERGLSWLYFGGGIAVGAVVLGLIGLGLVAALGLATTFGWVGQQHRLPTRPVTPLAAVAPASVTLTARASGEVSGCVSPTEYFRNRLTFEVPGSRLPATCKLVLGESRTVFVVHGSGDIACGLQDGLAVCETSAVGEGE